jgi:hypothetical protein
MRAEHVADLVSRLADGLEVLPGQVAGSAFPVDRLQDAAQAVRDATVRWAALAPGQTWVFEWAAAPARRPRDLSPR